MWDCHWWRCLLPTTLQKPPNQSLLLPSHHQNDAVCPNCISFAALARMLTSWLNRRRRRYLLLILCSPFLIPLFFAMCPLICAVEIFLLVCRRRRKAAEGGDRRSESVDGGEEVGLLQRYLEDQLILVIESAYDLEEDGGEKVVEECGTDVQYFGSARPLLQ